MREVYALFSRYFYELPIFTFIALITRDEYEKRFFPPNNIVGNVSLYLGRTEVPEDEPVMPMEISWVVDHYNVVCVAFPTFEPVAKKGEVASFEEVG